MYMMLVLTLVSLLVSVAQAGPPPERVPLKVVAVTASSTLPKFQSYTFDAANLIDGRVDTSWQPAKSDTMGVGQWVELDLGATYEVSSVEIVQGLQKVDPKLGDLFCRNNRLASATIFFDDGSHGLVQPSASAKTEDATTFLRTDTPAPDVKPVTRFLRLVVDMVHEPVDWTDMAIAEIRVFGRPVDAPKVDATTITCDGVGAWPLKVAVIDFCAVNAETRAKRDCANLVYAFATCRVYYERTSGSHRSLPEVAADDIAKGKVIQSFTINGDRHHLEFERAADGRWSVKRHTRLDEAGKPAPPADETLIEFDEHGKNPCFEKLGKERAHG